MAKINLETEVGQRFFGNSKSITLGRLWMFSGGPLGRPNWPHKNLHTDHDVTQRIGLPGVIAAGTQLQAYLTEMMIDLFGEAWMAHGTMELKFIKTVLVGDLVLSKATVESKRTVGSDQELTLDVWCENQDGVKVVVGTVTGRFPASPVHP